MKKLVTKDHDLLFYLYNSYACCKCYIGNFFEVLFDIPFFSHHRMSAIEIICFGLFGFMIAILVFY